MKRIVIVGAGGFGREVEMLIEQINAVSHEWELLGFIDDGVAAGTRVGFSEVLGPVAELMELENLYVVLAIGNPFAKAEIISLIPHHVHYAILIHPNVLIGKRVEIGEGSIICAGTIITTDIKIGQHVILNLGCTVGHDTEIGDFCSFMPSINISGEVVIENSVYVGTGAKIINQLSIGAETIIGAGAVVSKSLPARCTAVGIPAKPIKYHDSNS
jgi:sugar O-acyltransferase (sialic acid O-acetyltransferase NeuD family)